MNTEFLIHQSNDISVWRFVVSEFVTNCYIIAYKDLGLAIDIGDDAYKIYDFTVKSRIHIDYIIATHGHIDHVAGIYDFMQYTKAPFFIEDNDVHLVKSLPMQAALFGLEAPKVPQPTMTKIEQLQQILSPYNIKVFYTPGHSPGSIVLAFLDENIVFTGDVLFKDSIGRTDLMGGDYNTLINSIKTNLLTLADNTKVFPGHGDPTTIGYEKQNNPFLR